MVIDYQALIKFTVKNCCLLPRTDDQFDTLQGSQLCTSINIDAASGVHQILFQESDRPKPPLKTPSKGKVLQMQSIIARTKRRMLNAQQWQRHYYDKKHVPSVFEIGLQVLLATTIAYYWYLQAHTQMGWAIQGASSFWTGSILFGAA